MAPCADYDFIFIEMTVIYRVNTVTINIMPINDRIFIGMQVSHIHGFGTTVMDEEEYIPN
jgi:hypothetical protein